MPYIGRELDRGNYLKLDDISSSFDGSTTTFNLTAGGKAFFPGSAFSILVNLAGVAQEPEAAYQINNSQITFATAPVAGDQFFCIVLGVALGASVPGNGTVNGAQLAKPFNYDGYFYLDDANNRVGVGTATPAKPLHVVGEGQFDSVRVLGDLQVDGTTTTLDTVVTEVDRLEVGANNNTVAIAVTQSGSGDAAHFIGGDVGIGTNNPLAKLTVSDGANGLEFNPNSATAIVSYNRVTSAYAPIGLQGSYQSFRIGGVGEVVRITGIGSVGIGLTNPSYKFDVNGGTENIIARFKSTDGDSLIKFEDSATTDQMLLGANGENLYFRTDVGRYIFRGNNNGTEIFTIKQNGFVGVSTAEPQVLFETYSATPIIRSKHSGAQKYIQMYHDGTDARLDFSSGDLILRSASNTERFRITSSGRVGLGTASPSQNLHIQDSSGPLLTFDDATTQFGHLGSYNKLVGSGATDTFLVSSANSKPLVLRAPANQTISFDIASTERLRISSIGAISASSATGTTPLVTLTNSSIAATHGEVLKLITGRGGSVADIGVISVHNTGGEIFRVQNDGKVGIGETAPAANLVVKQSGTTFTTQSQTVALFQRSSTTGHGAKIAIISGNAANSQVNFGDTDSEEIGMIQYVHTDNSLRFITNASESLRITSAGKIGIGTVNPGNNFELRTDSNDEGILIKSIGSTSNALNFDANRSGAGNALGAIRGRWNGTTVGQISFVAGSDTTNKDDGDIIFGTESAASNGNVNATERLRIKSDGDTSLSFNLLIPEDKKIHFEGTSSDDLNAIWKADTENTLFVTSRYNIANIIDANNDDTASFWSVRHNGTTLSGSSELMRVQSNGRIGIGLSAPETRFHLKGAGQNEGALIENNHNTTTISGNTAKGAFPHAISLYNSNNQGGATAGQNTNLVSIGFGCLTDSAHSNAAIVGHSMGSAGTMDLAFYTESSNTIGERLRIKANGTVIPGSDNGQDLGSSSKRWANLYTGDLQLSNEGGANDVDGTWGQYTIQEGEDDLFLINRRSGKKYKFMLQEVN